MRKTVAIVQSSYIPWKGYFDLINRVDELILLDDVQYTRRDWRNRNKIKTPHGLRWLTIPVAVKGKYHQSIKDTRVSDRRWASEHWRSIVANYARAPHFEEYRGLFAQLYEEDDEPFLSRINHRFITAICGELGIETKISWSMDYELVGSKTARLVHLCRQAGASDYLSGPSARAYIEPQLFDAAGIGLQYMDYSGYPQYDQPYPPFEHQVSIIDLLFCVGREAPRYMMSF